MARLGINCGKIWLDRIQIVAILYLDNGNLVDAKPIKTISTITATVAAIAAATFNAAAATGAMGATK